MYSMLVLFLSPKTVSELPISSAQLKPQCLQIAYCHLDISWYMVDIYLSILLSSSLKKHVKCLKHVYHWKYYSSILDFTIADVFMFKWVNLFAIISEGGVWYALPFIFLILESNLLRQHHVIMWSLAPKKHSWWNWIAVAEGPLVTIYTLFLVFSSNTSHLHPEASGFKYFFPIQVFWHHLAYYLFVEPKKKQWVSAYQVLLDRHHFLQPKLLARDFKSQKAILLSMLEIRWSGLWFQYHTWTNLHFKNY